MKIFKTYIKYKRVSVTAFYRIHLCDLFDFDIRIIIMVKVKV